MGVIVLPGSIPNSPTTQASVLHPPISFELRGSDGLVKGRLAVAGSGGKCDYSEFL